MMTTICANKPFLFLTQLAFVLFGCGISDEEAASFEKAAAKLSSHKSVVSFCKDDQACLEEIEPLLNTCTDSAYTSFDNELSEMSASEQFEYSKALARILRMKIIQCTIRQTTKGQQAATK